MPTIQQRTEIEAIVRCLHKHQPRDPEVRRLDAIIAEEMLWSVPPMNHMGDVAKLLHTPRHARRKADSLRQLAQSYAGQPDLQERIIRAEYRRHPLEFS